MKKILLLVLLSIYCINVRATVFVSGVISANTTWTKANSPYIVNGNLTVDSAVLLTIQPGVVVQVDSGFFFKVNGSLLAQGSTIDSIRFTSTSAAPSRRAWSGIMLTGKSPNDSGMI